jgi:hypothetical protein
MIPPDREIFEVEQRLARRRAQVKHEARQAGQAAMQKLASPVALLAAAGIGFVLANSFARRRREPPHPERRKSDHLKKAKATGIAGVLTTGAMWLIKAQFGSPLNAASALLEKFSRRKAATSARGDNVTPLRRVQR